MNENNLIYALKDPETKQIRYVGKSTSGIKRPRQHKRPYQLLAPNHKNNWIKLLLSKGLEYEIVILEENIPKEQLNDKEKLWVAHYKALGADLTNQTEGGEGTWGYKMKEETKELMAEKRKAWFKEHQPTDIMRQTCFKRKEYQTIDGVQYKHCWKCDKNKTLDVYGKYANSWDGLSPECRDCHNEIAKSYRIAHITKLSPDELQKSYDDRKESMRQGILNAYKNDPSIKQKLSKARSKPILQCEITTGKVVKEFASALEAKKAGFANSNIGQAIKYKRPYRGFMWRFK